MPRSAEELEKQLAFMVGHFYLNIPKDRQAIVFGGNKFWHKENRWCYSPVEVDGRIEIQRWEDRLFTDLGRMTKYYIKQDLWFDENDKPVGLDNFHMMEKLVDELRTKDAEKKKEDEITT